MSFRHSGMGSNIDMSSATSSRVMDIADFTTMAIQLVWGTGTPVGTFTVEVSTEISAAGDGTDVVLWDTITGTEVEANGAGKHTINLCGVGSRWLRVHYEPQSGSGVFFATFCGKGG